jgi:predicted aldo/keto reductase-like oxidoreductase
MAMQMRPLGSTGLSLSAVGFGTCQLQMVPEEQAIATLRRGFELGVNWVHADLGYGGVDRLVARAIAESGRSDIMPVANGWGNVERTEEAFVRTCEVYGRDHLELFGLSCIDDDDLILKHDVWGPRGLVAHLQEMRREGRIRATWCSTHGEPEYVERLIESGAFDAIMLAYNPLGFHALTYDAKREGKPYENIPETARRIFPLAAERGVGLLVMKPLAGGLLIPGKAFTPRRRFSHESAPLAARDVLRSILQMPGVTAVVPGTASLAEAEENALAGHEPLVINTHTEAVVTETTAHMRTELCSRCAECEPTCSKSLPISWLFREAYMWSYSADLFDAIDRHHYFHLHPDTTLACVTCENRTCVCPYGLDIPQSLTAAHEQMLDLRERGLMHTPPAEAEAHTRRGHTAARVLLVDTPPRMAPGEVGICRLWLENVGTSPWVPRGWDGAGQQVYLRAKAGNQRLGEGALRHEAAAGERTFVTFELNAPPVPGDYEVNLEMVTPRFAFLPDKVTNMARRVLRVEQTSAADIVDLNPDNGSGL